MTTLILDGHNLLFRAFTSLPRSITGTDGKPIQAVHGLVGAILRLIREYDAEHVVAAFDVPVVPTFRHDLYPAYQGQRGPLGGEYADEFEWQVEAARKLLPGLGIPALTAEGYEADDIMGTLAQDIADRAEHCLVVSTDRDLLQLVRPGIGVVTPASPPVEAMTAQDVIARLGVAPEQITTWKALAGDASDNIPGVKGIGTKTAALLATQYGTLEAIYDHLDDLPARTRTALQGEREKAFLFRRLVTLVTDVALPLEPDSLPRLQVASDASPGSILRAAGLRPE